jgi:excinuclease ABC subunit A
MAKIEVPAKRREGNGKFLKLTGATGNNENVSIAFG